MKAKAWSDIGKLEWAKKGRQVASGGWKKMQKKKKKIIPCNLQKKCSLIDILILDFWPPVP